MGFGRRSGYPKKQGTYTSALFRKFKAERQDNPAFKPFMDYLRSTLSTNSPLHLLLDPSPSPAFNSHPALVFSLRMLNLPLPLIPPLYKMLLSELKESPSAPKFTHWLVWGRGYRLEGSEQGMGLDLNQPAYVASSMFWYLC